MLLHHLYRPEEQKKFADYLAKLPMKRLVELDSLAGRSFDLEKQGKREMIGRRVMKERSMLAKSVFLAWVIFTSRGQERKMRRWFIKWAVWSKARSAHNAQMVAIGNTRSRVRSARRILHAWHLYTWKVHHVVVLNALD